jgi:hypothetical protein
MAKLVKKISKKAGLPPGTLVHIGEEQKDKVKLRLIDYNEDHFGRKSFTRFSRASPTRTRRPSPGWTLSVFTRWTSSALWGSSTTSTPCCSKTS